MNHCCESLKDENLYILEVFVNHVRLYVDKLDRIDPSMLGVDLIVAGFPFIRIFQTDFKLTKPERKKEISRDQKYRIVYFNAGKMYLFPRNPSELVQTIKSTPVMLDVYRIKAISNCPYDVLKDPLGVTKIPLPDCLCDQITMASNDAKHLPRSYEIKNSFGLIDIDSKPAGKISLLIRLTCFGKTLTKKFSVIGKKMLYTNQWSVNEYLCTKVPYDDEEERRAAEDEAKVCLPDKVFEESELDAPPRPFNIAGLLLVCKELCKRDGYPIEVVVQKDEPWKKRKIENIVEMDSKRRKINDDSSEHYPLISRTFFLRQKACTSIGCAGVICTGTK